ncbi:MAG: ribonuclease HII [Patescibacteria group bacterium]
MQFPNFKSELECIAKGYSLVLGCDEAGRGPVAGPVVAAACVLNPATIGGKRSKSKWYYRVRDSKLTTEGEREILDGEIKNHALAWGVGEVSHKGIDKINIHNASLLAMRRAVENLLGEVKNKKAFLFVDGKFKIPGLEIGQVSVIDGDAKILSIAAASIIAKVHRDNIMKRLDGKFPGYGFARHKGYSTREHRQALAKLGISLVHRKTFVRI